MTRDGRKRLYARIKREIRVEMSKFIATKYGACITCLELGIIGGAEFWLLH